MDKDEKKWECVDLVKIDLSHNAIPSISDEIGALTTLTSIKLAQNKLTTLPEGLFELTALKFLDLSHNELQGTLSESFGALTNLKELSLAANKLSKLPEAIADLIELEVLRLEENTLTTLPTAIGKMKKLHTLTAHTNQLSSLPHSFGSLRNLQTLDIKKNRLDSVTDQLATLQNLKYVDLRQNKLVVFPSLPQSAALDQVFLGFNALARIDEASILRVKDSITVLDLRDNKLTELPVNMAWLIRLKTLDVSNNDLSDLPPGLGYLKYLNHFMVDGNPLRAIRRGVISSGCESLKKYLRTRGSPPEGVSGVMEQEIDELEQLRERERAAKAAATGFGPAISTNSSMRSSGNGDLLGHVLRDAAASGKLDLANHVLQSLPRELHDPSPYSFQTTLVHLDLSKNHLTSLPPELGRLETLVTLTVEENQLRSIDPAVATLPRLQRLHLRKNQLTTDAINAFLSDCSEAFIGTLIELDLRNNQLTQMPHKLRYLTSLHTLQLAVNKLETLDGFPWHELAHLSIVSVSDNKLKSLGRVYDMPLLSSLSFENNNLTRVPCELGLCPHLRAIYMNGNPQKTVRGAIIAKGSLEILMYLKNKVPPGTTLAPPSPAKTLPPHPANPKPSTSSAAVVVATKTAKKNLSMYASTAEDEDDHAGSKAHKTHSIRPSCRDDSIDTTPPTGTPNRTTNDDMDAQISYLEFQLERHELSGAKRFALKKELAMVRSAKIRAARAPQAEYAN